MDAKEAIKELTKMQEYENYVLNCIADDDEPETIEVQRNIKALQLALEALEKQVPKEPKDEYGYYYCPACGKQITTNVFNEQTQECLCVIHLQWATITEK